jgi:hypothetical protein
MDLDIEIMEKFEHSDGQWGTSGAGDANNDPRYHKFSVASWKGASAADAFLAYLHSVRIP